LVTRVAAVLSLAEDFDAAGALGEIFFSAMSGVTSPSIRAPKGLIEVEGIFVGTAPDVCVAGHENGGDLHHRGGVLPVTSRM
jgi:hypothetical protein